MGQLPRKELNQHFGTKSKFLTMLFLNVLPAQGKNALLTFHESDPKSLLPERLFIFPAISSALTEV